MPKTRLEAFSEGVLAYLMLQRCIIAAEGEQTALKQAVGRDWKGKASLLAYLAGIGVSLVWPWLAQALYVAVALLWLIPDRRIERVLQPHA
jgi:uncharacterized membrane protein